MLTKIYSSIVAGVCNTTHAMTGFVKRHAVPALKAVAVGVMLTFGCPAFADGGVDFSSSSQAITDAATEMQKYITPVQNVCYIIAALIGLVGGLTTAIAMSNHEQDVTKKAAFTFGGMVFMVVIGYLVPLFFGFTGS